MPTPYYNPYEEEAAIAREQAEAAAARAEELSQKSAQVAAEIDARKRAKAKPRRGKRDAETTAQRSEFYGRAKMFAGILMMLLAAYMLVATLSMLANPGADQVAVQYNSVGQIVSSGTAVDNAAGPAGAKLSNFLLSGTFGLGSFVIIYWLVMVGLRLGNWIRLNFWTFTLKSLVLTTTISMVAGLFTYDSELVLRLGGNHGYYVNNWLIERTTGIGALCVSIALVALVIIIYLTQITAAITMYRNKVAALKEARLAHARKEKETQEKLAEQLAGSAHESEPVEQPEENEPEETTESLIVLDDEVDDEPLNAEQRLQPTPSEGGGNTFNPDAEMEITAHQIEEADVISTDTYDPTAELSHFHFPSIDLLEDRAGSKVTVDKEEQEKNKQRIIDALAQFNIRISDIKATVGPTITLFEVVPAEGQRIAAIKRVEEDLALALKAKGIRIIAPIPGKGTIGIEVPNSDPQIVSMRTIISSKKFQECKYELPMALGATISNEVFIADLAKMPHLLVAGATGQGKSVGLNAIITSLLYKKHPAELKFVLVDPKMVEFSLYRVLERHYLAKLPDEDEAVITDCNKVVTTLNSLCVEMDNRYSLLSKAGCRGIGEYNQKFISRHLNPEKGHRYMPYIVVIIDEFADLIMQAGKEVEVPLCRIAQKARAVGIHAIIATQRPSTNVITGLIKAQFPGRIAFRVAQMVDSKTILDRSGAHQLIGKGDMFFSTNGSIERVQCAFVDTPEVEAICAGISEQQGFANAYELPEYIPDMAVGGDSAAFGGHPGSSFDRDPLFEEAARFLVTTGSTASTSSLQRRYNIGYNRAGRLMDQLEAAGIVGPAFGSKPRNVLVDPMTLDSILGM